MVPWGALRGEPQRGGSVYPVERRFILTPGRAFPDASKRKNHHRLGRQKPARVFWRWTGVRVETTLKAKTNHPAAEVWAAAVPPTPRRKIWIPGVPPCFVGGPFQPLWMVATIEKLVFQMVTLARLCSVVEERSARGRPPVVPEEIEVKTPPPSQREPAGIETKKKTKKKQGMFGCKTDNLSCDRTGPGYSKKKRS